MPRLSVGGEPGAPPVLLKTVFLSDDSLYEQTHQGSMVAKAGLFLLGFHSRVGVLFQKDLVGEPDMVGVSS